MPQAKESSNSELDSSNGKPMRTDIGDGVSRVPQTSARGYVYTRLCL
jgi:hypothetical protein